MKMYATGRIILSFVVPGTGMRVNANGGKGVAMKRRIFFIPAAMVI